MVFNIQAWDAKLRLFNEDGHASTGEFIERFEEQCHKTKVLFCSTISQGAVMEI